MTSSTPTPPTASSSTHQGPLPGLDGLRALAALSVFFFHSLWRTSTLQPLAPVLGHGDIGVEIFFVLSGFLVARPFVRHAVSGGPPIPFGDFWRKRIARIWPAYLVALLGAVIIGVGTVEGASGWFKHTLILQTEVRHGDGTGLRVSWTLAVEVAFYVMILPLAALVARARTRSHDAWVGLCLLLLVAGSVAIVVTSYHPTPNPWRVLPPYLPSFAGGMLLAAAEVDPAPGTWSAALLTGTRRLASRPLLCVGLAAGLFGGLILFMPANATTPAVEPGFERTVQSFVQTAVAFLVLAPLALRGTKARWLEHRTLVAIGVASFGFYLWHIQVLRLVRPMLQGPAVVAVLGLGVAVAVAYLAGEASRRVIEQPARRLIVGRRR